MITPSRLLVPAVLLGVCLCAAAGHAQDRAIDFSYGRWWHEDGSFARTFAASFQRPIFGGVGYGLAVTHLDDHLSVLDRTQSGGEVSLLVGGRTGLYGVTAGGLGMRHVDGKVDANWSAGGGYAIRPLSVLRIGLEARYRVEDERARGFWRLNPADRRGLMLQAGVALRLGGDGRGRAGGGGTVAVRPVDAGPAGAPSIEKIRETSRSAGARGDVAVLAASVVETALGAMGTPYQWGGTNANGFDCSGLIQHAYGEQGIILPRVSRDQIRQGDRVDARVDRLRPGDILGFAVDGNGVSHVGLYVGDGQFIHSSAEGVQLSSLTAADGNSRWWQQRWTTARRVLN